MFDFDAVDQVVVIGVGGYGVRRVSQLEKYARSANRNVCVKFVVMDTDAQCIAQSEVPEKYVIGDSGFPVGFDDNRQISKKEEDQIHDIIDKYWMASNWNNILIIGGLGGATFGTLATKAAEWTMVRGLAGAVIARDVIDSEVPMKARNRDKTVAWFADEPTLSLLVLPNKAPIDLNN